MNETNILLIKIIIDGMMSFIMLDKLNEIHIIHFFINLFYNFISRPHRI